MAKKITPPQSKARSTKKTAGYKELYEYFAQRQAERYSMKKFLPISPAGYKDWRRERYAMALLELQPTDIFLDMGCATGKQTKMAAEIVKSAYGVDISETFIKKAKEGNSKASFYVGDIDNLPFKSEYFDKIFCGEILEHVPTLKKSLGSINRVLKKGGTLVVSIPNENSEGTLWRRIKNKITGKKLNLMTTFSVEEYQRLGHPHVRVFNYAKARDEIERYGFKLMEYKACRIIDFPFYNNVFAFFRIFRLQGPGTRLLDIADTFLEDKEPLKEFCSVHIMKFKKT